MVNDYGSTRWGRLQRSGSYLSRVLHRRWLTSSRRWSGAKMVSATVADGSAASGWWATAAEGWFMGLGWWLMACVGSFFFFLWFVGCGGWLFWQLVWCFNDDQDWQIGFVSCWVKGLWLTGNLLVAWYVWVLRDGFLMLVWQRCHEGILKVVWWLDFWRWKIYGESFFFFFFVWFWIDLWWYFKHIGVCSDIKIDAGQPEQNWNNGKI